MECSPWDHRLQSGVRPGTGRGVLTSRVGAESGEEIVSNVSLHAHLLSVNLENVGPASQIRQSELDLPVETARSNEGWVESIRTVRSHENLQRMRMGEKKRVRSDGYLDVSSRIETVELIDQLEHSTLHLVVSSHSIVESKQATS